MEENHNHARKYNLTEYGLWRIWSCLPDSEVGDVVVSREKREVLEIAVGRFIDVLAYAVELQHFRIRHEDEKLHSMSADAAKKTYDAKADIGSINAGYVEKVDGPKFFHQVPKTDDPDLEKLIGRLEPVK